jgi:hypothetical protein
VSKAEAVVGDWPSDEALAFYEVSKADVDATWEVFAPIVDSLGLKYQWKRQCNAVTATVMRPE